MPRRRDNDAWPESYSDAEKGCPKCHAESGDDWSQCGGDCPMPASPHFNPQRNQPMMKGLSPKVFDLVGHLYRQGSFSARAFGPLEDSPRVAGVLDHIRKEIAEVEADYKAGRDPLEEWIDVIILASDGAMRCGATPEQICAALEAKQTKNENRKWPDWRTADPNKAIEHVREPHEYRVGELRADGMVEGSGPNACNQEEGA